MADLDTDPLVTLGFTSLEAEIYTRLLEESAITGYRIAQALGKPAANVYKAIESLAAKGAVLVDDGGRRVCRAVPPDELLARLERRFRSASRQAADSLAQPVSRGPDQRIYQLQSPEAVFERARAMLGRATDVVLLDGFSEPIEAIRDELESAVARDVLVGLKTYDPLTIPGVEVVLAARSEEARRRWSGDWLNLVVDGRECLIAYLTDGGTRVGQAIWSGSPYLAWTYHSALAAELRLDALEATILAGASSAELLTELNRLRRLRALEAPGYREMVSRNDPAREFVGEPAGESAAGTNDQKRRRRG